MEREALIAVRDGTTAHGDSSTPARLQGHRIMAVSVASDDNGVTAIHFLGERGVALKIEPGDHGYLAVSEYYGWRIDG